MPSTLMSSSTSGQWMPCPAPISRKLARWGGVASESRQDQARGTLMTRPSARCATISSFVTRTSRIRGSPPAAVVIPRLHDLLVMLSNDLAYPSQLVCCKPMDPLDLLQRRRSQIALPAMRTANHWHALDEELGTARTESSRHPANPSTLLSTDVAHHVSPFALQCVHCHHNQLAGGPDLCHDHRRIACHRLTFHQVLSFLR